MKKTILALGLIFSISLLIRYAYIRSTVIDNPIRADAIQYVKYGYNLAFRQVYSVSPPSVSPPVPDSLRSPGYPVLVASSLLLGGEKGFYKLLLNFQVVLGALVPVLTFLLARKFLPFVWAVAGASLVVISPHLVAMTGYVLTETLFGFLLLAALLWFVHALETRRALHFAGAGTVFGMAYLTNETALFLPFVFIAAACVSDICKNNIHRQNLYRYAVFFLIFLLFPGSWNLRNALNLPADAPTGKQRAIATACHGTYPGFIYKDPAFRYFPYREDPEYPEFCSSWESFRKILWSRVQERPWRYLSWYLIEKPVYLWSWNILQGQGDVFVYPVRISLFDRSTIAEFLRVFMKLIHPLIVLLAFAGMIWFPLGLKQPPRSHPEFFVFIILIYYTFMYMIFAPWPRYTVPLRPELYLCALWMLQRVRQPRHLIKRAMMDDDN